MPELPEVETVVRDLRAGGLIGRRIEAASVTWPRIIAVPEATDFVATVTGLRFEDIARRGKYIVARLSGPRALLIHLRMTGRLTFVPAGTPRTKHEHVAFALEDGRELRFHDTRKFGRLYLVSDADAIVGHLGPEPLSDAFTARDFLRRMETRRGVLKPLLLDQEFVAGLGNIYVDEALWRARLHPQRRAEALTLEERRRLYRAIRAVLRQGVASMGTSLGVSKTNFYSVAGRRGRNQDRLKVFRRTGEPCPRCATPIRRMVVAQRGTHICPACQRLRGTI